VFCLDLCSLFVLNNQAQDAVCPMSYPRRFPPPWKIEEQQEAYVVTDGLGQRLAYLYFENEAIRQGILKRLSKDDAWRIARAITRIPGLMQRD